MKFGSASMAVADLDDAVRQIGDQTRSQLNGARPDLVCTFFTSHFEDQADRLAKQLRQNFPDALLMGCSAEGVIGPNTEHEQEPAISVVAAHLPDVRLAPFRANPDDLAHPQEAHAWMDQVRAIATDTPPSYLLLADPFSVPINAVLKLFNISFPHRPVLGGMVSGCEGPEQAVLIQGDNVYRDGAIGLCVSGDLDLRTIVSQGCRPLGERYVITKGQKNVIQQLGGKPALQQLRELLRQLSGDDLIMAEQSLFVGMAIDERKDTFKRGDYVIRHLLAGDPNSGAIMVGDEIRVGTSIQFHVRDHQSADQDLRELLTAARKDEPAAGALLFTCNGRGTRMWDQPNHDVSAINEICGPVPLGGFFAAGELGPVEGRNFIHGHTASLALFYPASDHNA